MNVLYALGYGVRVQGANLKWHEAHPYKPIVTWKRIVLTLWFSVGSSASPISWLFCVGSKNLILDFV